VDLLDFYAVGKINYVVDLEKKAIMKNIEFQKIL